MKADWTHVAQLGLMIVGGIVCLALGQPQVGLLLVGGAIGNASPKSLMELASRKPKDPQ